MTSARSRLKRAATGAERSRERRLLRTEAHGPLESGEELAEIAQLPSDDLEELYRLVAAAAAHPLITSERGLRRLTAEKYLWFYWASSAKDRRHAHARLMFQVHTDMDPDPESPGELKAVSYGIRTAQKVLSLTRRDFGDAVAI